MTLRTVSILLLGVLVGGCTTSEEESGEFVVATHPTDGGYVTPSGLELDTIYLQESSSRPASNLSRLSSIGKLNGNRNEVFGRIEDAAIGQDGEYLYLLDSRYNEVRVFELDGTFVTKLGGEGEGPGEFSFPNAIAVGHSKVFVTDSRQRSLHVLEMRDDLLVHMRSVRLSVAPFDICISEEGPLVIHGIDPGAEDIAVLHMLNESLSVEKSFGAPYTEGGGRIQRKLARGSLACPSTENSAGGELYFLPEQLPYLLRYGVDGTLQSLVRVSGFKPFQYLLENDGGIRSSLPSSGAHVGLGVVSPELEDDEILVQFGTMTRESMEKGEEYGETITIAFKGKRESEWVGERGLLGRLLAARRGLILSTKSTPYPMLTLWEVE